MLRAFILLLIVGLCSCGFVSRPEHNSLQGTSKLGANDLEFANVRSQVLAPRCLSCHAQYASYEGVRRELNEITQAVTANRMPKGSVLTVSQKDLLLDWIAAGSPEFLDDAPSAPEFSEVEPNWDSLSRAVFFPRCLACHSPQGQAKFLDLSTFDAVLAAKDRQFGIGKKLIDVQSPDQSYLIEVIEDPVEPMPPTNSNIRVLNLEEIAALKEWIRLGLPATR